MTKKKMDIITIKEDFSHIFEIKEALQKNELVAIHGDRFLEGSKTINAEFLGQEARFPAGPFYLAIKYNKPITFVSAVKESRKQYHFFATMPKDYRMENPESFNNELLQTMVSDYAREMEKIIEKYPEQWFNYYYFWNT